MSMNWKADAEGQRGPGWYDVTSYVRAMEKQYGMHLVLFVEKTGLGNKSWGLRVTAAFAEVPEIFGCGSYGPAHPGNGQKSMSAAMYHALLKLDHEMSIYWIKAHQALQLPLPSESDD